MQLRGGGTIIRTTPFTYGLGVILGNVVVDPASVSVGFLWFGRILDTVQALGYHAVAEETGQERDL